MDKDAISANLRQLRIKANLTQKELAEKISISQQAVAKWEAGESIPDIQLLLTLKDLYKVTLDQLMSPDQDQSNDNPITIVVSELNQLVKTDLFEIWLDNFSGLTVSNTIYLDFFIRNISDDIINLESMKSSMIDNKNKNVKPLYRSEDSPPYNKTTIPWHDIPDIIPPKATVNIILRYTCDVEEGKLFLVVQGRSLTYRIDPKLLKNIDNFTAIQNKIGSTPEHDKAERDSVTASLLKYMDTFRFMEPIYIRNGDFYKLLDAYYRLKLTMDQGLFLKTIEFFKSPDKARQYAENRTFIDKLNSVADKKLLQDLALKNELMSEAHRMTIMVSNDFDSDKDTIETKIIYQLKNGGIIPEFVQYLDDPTFEKLILNQVHINDYSTRDKYRLVQALIESKVDLNKSIRYGLDLLKDYKERDKGGKEIVAEFVGSMTEKSSQFQERFIKDVDEKLRREILINVLNISSRNHQSFALPETMMESLDDEILRDYIDYFNRQIKKKVDAGFFKQKPISFRKTKLSASAITSLELPFAQIIDIIVVNHGRFNDDEVVSMLVGAKMDNTTTLSIEILNGILNEKQKLAFYMQITIPVLLRSIIKDPILKKGDSITKAVTLIVKIISGLDYLNIKPKDILDIIDHFFDVLNQEQLFDLLQRLFEATKNMTSYLRIKDNEYIKKHRQPVRHDSTVYSISDQETKSFLSNFNLRKYSSKLKQEDLNALKIYILEYNQKNRANDDDEDW